MTRVPSAVLLAALIAVSAVGFALYAWYHPTGFKFIQRNDAAFQTLPVYPGGKFASEHSSPYYAGGSPLSRIVGYTTTREYLLPTAIPAEGIVDYYLYELRSCEVVWHGDSSAEFRCRGTVDVTVAVDGPPSSERYELTVDSR